MIDVLAWSVCVCVRVCVWLSHVASSHQVEVLACLTEEEALHTILQRLINDIMKSGITTPKDRVHMSL